VIPFRLVFQPGVALSEQILYAATKAIVSGQLRPGDPFPSVRSISAAEAEYGCRLVLGHQSGCLQWVVTIVAAMSVKELFLPMLGGDLDEDTATAKDMRATTDRAKA